MWKKCEKAALNELSVRYSKQEDDLTGASALDPRLKSVQFLYEDEEDNCFKAIISAMLKNDIISVQVKVEPQDENSQNC